MDTLNADFLGENTAEPPNIATTFYTLFPNPDLHDIQANYNALYVVTYDSVSNTI